MSATSTAGYAACVWCGAANPLLPSGQLPPSCVHCQLDPNPKNGNGSAKKSSSAKSGKSSSSRKGAPKRGEHSSEPLGKPVIGIDPGARYTGVVVRDGDVVLHSTTLVRPKELESATEWALVVVAQIREIVKDFPAMTPFAVEGISDPKGFQHGKQAAINPRDIIRAGIVLGAVVATWPNATIVPPGNNGSQHASHYPAELRGRRPKDLPGSANGAGTRGHEQSAYDVAGKGASIIYPVTFEPLNFS